MDTEEKIRMYLRQASNFGERGLGYDFDEEEINEDWQDFEDEAVREIMEEVPTTVAYSDDSFEPLGCHGCGGWD